MRRESDAGACGQKLPSRHSRNQPWHCQRDREDKAPRSFLGNDIVDPENAQAHGNHHAHQK
jgi:hypothetical protein